jgi:DNA-binding MarR family transcriptional regulator
MQLSDAWIRIMTKMATLDGTPRDYGSGDLLHNAEIHTIMQIGRDPGQNITTLAAHEGISKSAISQMVSRLEQKGLVKRYRSPDNAKETLLKLTAVGRIAHLGHEQHHAVIFARMQEKLGDLSPEQVAGLMNFFQAIEETIEEFIPE